MKPGTCPEPQPSEYRNGSGKNTDDDFKPCIPGRGFVYFKTFEFKKERPVDDLPNSKYSIQPQPCRPLQAEVHGSRTLSKLKLKVTYPKYDDVYLYQQREPMKSITSSPLHTFGADDHKGSEASALSADQVHEKNAFQNIPTPQACFSRVHLAFFHTQKVFDVSPVKKKFQ
jgi:hypothetical protein